MNITQNYPILGLLKNSNQKMDYLTFRPHTSNATIKLTLTGEPYNTILYYNKNDQGWKLYEKDSATTYPVIQLQNLDSFVQFYGETKVFSKSSTGYYKFIITGDMDSSGNIMSLINFQSNFLNSNQIYVFAQLFNGCKSLYSAPKLPAKILSRQCYLRLFYNCKNLVNAPELPAEILNVSCYKYMFYGCSNLITAPELPAKKLYNQCYYQMFEGCLKLSIAPELPATILANYCYSLMFKDCSNLINIPSLLPATTLANYCYMYMFDNCQKLTITPLLPASSLTPYCYTGMFQGCKALTTMPILSATKLAENCYYEMFNNCTYLVNVTDLPATTLAPSCYLQMFHQCTSLVNAPNLFATILAKSCYASMFQNCRSLVNAPELPATILAENCYAGMFQNCSSLVNAPELSAPILVNQCYYEMFKGCISLNNISANFIDWNESVNATYNWVNTVSENGTFTKHTALSTIYDSSHIPVNWNISEEIVQQPLRFTNTANTPITVQLNGQCQYKSNIQYSRDNGTTWINYDYNSNGIELLTNQYVDFKNTNETFFQSNFNFIGDNPGIEIGGNLESLWNYKTKNLSSYSISVAQLFSNKSNITKCSKDLLKNIQLFVDKDSEMSPFGGCYFKLFNNCVNLLQAPDLPATTITPYCYYNMFDRCENLSSIPSSLPATALASHCYSGMFCGCTSLSSAPQLPATSLADYCYQNMFLQCANLINIPAILPATTLAPHCYQTMFEDCNSLQVAPELPATTLVDNCYAYMFVRCSLLSSITVRFTDWNYSGNCTSWWMDEVSNQGIFNCPSILGTQSTIQTGPDYCPETWTVNNI